MPPNSSCVTIISQYISWKTICVLWVVLITLHILVATEKHATQTAPLEYEIKVSPVYLPKQHLANDTEKNKTHGIGAIFQAYSPPPRYNKTLNRSVLSLKDAAIVSCISYNHMAESLYSCVSKLQHNELKNTPFYVYIANDITSEMTKVYKDFCKGVIIKKYSTLVKNLPESFAEFKNSYKFKILVTMEVLKLHPVVLYADASVRFRNQKDKNALNTFVKHVLNTSTVDMALIGSPTHNMYSTVDARMYPFFPEVEPQTMKNVSQYPATCGLFFGTSRGWQTVLRTFKCALEPNCMAPPNATSHGCDMKKIFSEPGKYSGCHRFDQAALNLVGYVESHNNVRSYGYKTNLIQFNKSPGF